MTIASVGTLGTGLSSTSTTSFTFATVTNALAAGDIGLLIIASDNIATADGGSKNHSMPTGGTGRWSRLGEYTNAPTAAAAVGATVSAWMFEATAALAIGATITCNFSAALVDKTCTFWKFTVAAGSTLMSCRETLPWPVTSEVTAANGFGSSAFTGLTSKSRLYFRALAKEGNAAANPTTALTVSASFTAVTAQQSRANVNAMAVRGEFRINTSTGETSNPTMAYAGDSAGLFFALEEVVKSAPTTQTDNFDDNVLNTSKWLNISGAGGSIAETGAQMTLLTGTGAGGVGAIATANVHDLTGSEVVAKLVQFQQTGTDFILAALHLYGDNGGYQWGIAGDNTSVNIYASAIENNYSGNIISAGVDLFSLAYSAATHAWFRLRHDAATDTIKFDTAPSTASNPPVSGDWVNRWSEPRRMPNNHRIALENTRISGTTLSTAIWDGYNTATTSATARTLTASLNAAIQAARTATASLNAAVRVDRTVSTNLTGAVRVNRTVSASLDANARVARTTTAALEAAVRYARTASANLTAAIRDSRNLTSAIDAAIYNARNVSGSLDAAVRTARTAAASLSAAVRYGRTLNSSADAAIRVSRTTSASVDAAIYSARNVSASLDALIRFAVTRQTSLGAAIRINRSGTSVLDAAIRRALAATTLLDAVIDTAGGRVITVSIDAAIRAALALTVSLDAFVSVTAIDEETGGGGGGGGGAVRRGQRHAAQQLERRDERDMREMVILYNRWLRS